MKKILVRIAVPVIQALVVKVVLEQVNKKLNKDDENSKGSKRTKKKR